MSRLAKLSACLIIGGSAAFFATGASAGIACVGDDCWHTGEAYEYPSSAGVIIHEDNWAAGPRVRWREHTGRGYWRGDDWTDF